MKNVQQSIEGAVGAQLLTVVVNQLRQLHKGWQAMSEAEQQTRIESSRLAVEQTLVGMVGRVARADHKAVPVEIEGVAFKAAVKATVVIKGDEHLHALVDYRGHKALLVFIDMDLYTRGMERIRGDADQPQLPLGATEPPLSPASFYNGDAITEEHAPVQTGDAPADVQPVSEGQPENPGDLPPEEPATLGEAEPETVAPEPEPQPDPDTDDEDEDDEPADEPPPADMGIKSREEALEILATVPNADDPRFAAAMAYIDEHPPETLQEARTVLKAAQEVSPGTEAALDKMIGRPPRPTQDSLE